MKTGGAEPRPYARLPKAHASYVRGDAPQGYLFRFASLRGHRPLRKRKMSMRYPCRRTESSAPTTVYRTQALFSPCHSEPVTDVTGVGIRSPFHANQRPKAATYLCRFAAKARFDNRPNPRRVFPKREGRSPLSLVVSRRGNF